MFGEVLNRLGVHGTLLRFSDSVQNSALSAVAAGCCIEKVLKTILFEDAGGSLYAAIVRGSDRVDRASVKRAFNASKLELVPFDQVIEKCGYPAGGVPPFGFAASFVMDSSLFDAEEVYAGGGDQNSLFRTTVGEIRRANSAIQAVISQPRDVVSTTTPKT